MISSAMMTVLAAWIVLFCVIAGLGHLVRRAFRLDSMDLQAWFLNFWMGYAVVIAVLQIWHFFSPIDWRTDVFLAVMGIIGFVWGLVKVKQRQPSSITRVLLFLVALAPIMLWVAFRALSPQMEFDTGMYHLNTIRWLNDYPAVLGLGNLHYRLAFNQSFFQFVAALNLYPLSDTGFHVGNSLLLIVLVAQLINTLTYALYRPRQFTVYHALAILFVPVVIYRATEQPYSANMSSPSPDLSVFIFMVVVTLELARFLFADHSDQEGQFSVFYVMALSVVGTTSKLSFAVFGAAAILLISAVWLVSHRQEWRVAVRQIGLWLIAAGLLIGLPWMIYGIITSGYPLFPMPIAALPVDWKIPLATTLEARDWIYSFARQPHADMNTVLSSWQWLSTWLQLIQDEFNKFLFTYPFILSVIAVGLSLLVLIAKRIFRRPAYDYRLWLPFIPALCSGLYWFFTAPDPRFAGAAPWLVAIWGWVFLGALIAPLVAKIPVRALVYIVLALPIGATVIILHAAFADFRGDIEWPALPVAPMKAFVTDSGLAVNVPANDNNPLQLWDSPPPSSPYSIPGLELRGQSLKDGFRTRQ